MCSQARPSPALRSPQVSPSFEPRRFFYEGPHARSPELFTSGSHAHRYYARGMCWRGRDHERSGVDDRLCVRGWVHAEARVVWRDACMAQESPAPCCQETGRWRGRGGALAVRKEESLHIDAQIDLADAGPRLRRGEHPRVAQVHRGQTRQGSPASPRPTSWRGGAWRLSLDVRRLRLLYVSRPRSVVR